ncbi:hypothetical protein DY000_02028407 [Brassica cretica]|uniref:Uncharacterized protein n=1 Tax=Brassica cretica TaxID=69181 RepID=A0ABQ7DR83_BRACR|nr:hypothetical protein DY000_02028407 [Brassica cretica]
MEKMTRDDGESKVDESSSKSNYVIRTKQNDPRSSFTTGVEAKQKRSDEKDSWLGNNKEKGIRVVIM